MFKTADRVFETSVTTGTGEYALQGAQVGFQPFSAMGTGNLCPYFATDDTDWEVGIGTILAAPARLARTHVLASSNAGAAVSWPTTTKKLRCGPVSQLDVPRALSKAVAGAAGTTVLTQDEQRRQVLEFTGALTGNRIIEVDATPWRWIVRNSTTGAFTLTIRVTGQTGVAVPQGRRAHIYNDGVDVRSGAGIPDAAGVSEFAAGVRMGFFNTTAPVGWTKETGAAYNDAALRITTGTVATGGADAFTTHFGVSKSTASHTLTESQMPPHVHGGNLQRSGASYIVSVNAGATGVTGNTDSTGGGTGHQHTLNSFNIKYADMIIATRA
jgi:hypothetical protein